MVAPLSLVWGSEGRVQDTRLNGIWVPSVSQVWWFLGVFWVRTPGVLSLSVPGWQLLTFLLLASIKRLPTLQAALKTPPVVDLWRTSGHWSTSKSLVNNPGRHWSACHCWCLAGGTCFTWPWFQGGDAWGTPVPLGFTVALSAGVAVEVSVWSSPVPADCSLTSQGPTLPLPGQLIRLPSIL